MQIEVLEELPAMAEQRIELNMLARIDSEQKATAAHVDNIDNSLRRLEREVSEINGKLKPPAETPAWMRFILYPLCVLATAAMVTAVITLLVKMNGVETFIRDNGAAIAGLRLEKLNLSNPKEAERILAQARKAKLRISSDVITESGTRFINESESTPPAWDAALAFLNYRSFLNPGLISASVKEAIEDKHIGTTYSQWVPSGKPGTTALLKAYGNAPLGEEAAVLTPIGFIPPNTSHGNKFIVLYDGDVVLDGTEFRHVIVSNARVIWEGAPIVMQDVYFINCTFDLPRAKGQNLASAILDNTSVSFNAS